MENLVNPKITEEYVLKIAKEYQIEVKRNKSSFSLVMCDKCINFKKSRDEIIIISTSSYNCGYSNKLKFKFLDSLIKDLYFYGAPIKNIPTHIIFKLSIDKFLVPHIKVSLLHRVNSEWISDKKLFFMFCDMYKAIGDDRNKILPEVIDYISELDNPVGFAIRS